MRLWKKEEEDAVELSRQGVEVWEPVMDCPTRYWVSNLGQVCSDARGRMEILKHTITRAGYPSVGVYVRQGEKSDTRLVHRMVISAFVGNAPSTAHTDIRHLNGQHADVRLFNLAWGTRSQNMQDVWEHRKNGVYSPPSVNDPKWFDGATADVRLLRVGMELLNEGKLNIADLGRLWACSPDVAASIAHGHTSREVPSELVVPPKTRRAPERKAAIMALVAEGLGFKDINERLNETLTAQDVYYYRSRLPKS
jgi:hypothetical protein